LGVYSEIHPHDITAEELKALPNVKGIIINGGPNNVIDGVAIDVLPEIYEAGIPVMAAGHDKALCEVKLAQFGNDEEAIAICEEEVAPVSSLVSVAIRNSDGGARKIRDAIDAEARASVGRLDRRLAALAIIAQIAPILGLLGTVIGFINVVMSVNASDIVSRADLLGGAMPSLVSAASGLALSIAATVMYGSLRVRLDRVVVEMEAAAGQIFGYLSSRTKGSAA
jgi:biopolymer transport protein ExbB/TolQ